MESVDRAVPTTDQPINGATLLHETRYLTSWVTPDNIEIKHLYKELTNNNGKSQKSKVEACWAYVARQLRYKPFLSTKVQVDGKTFIQNDAWLDPAEVVRVGIANCMNRSILLTSLLRQELPQDKVYVVLGNIKDDGHAWVVVRLDNDYILETTSPNIKSCFIEASKADIYSPVMLFNDAVVRYFPGRSVHEPFSNLFCVSWLDQYLNSRCCDAFV